MSTPGRRRHSTRCSRSAGRLRKWTTIGASSAVGWSAPAPGHQVRAYDKDMRSEEFLGEAGIEEEEYEIAYSRLQFARAEKGAADLRVTVLNRAGREVASTPIIFNAEAVEVAPDLVVSAGLPEHERLTSVARAAHAGRPVRRPDRRRHCVPQRRDRHRRYVDPSGSPKLSVAKSS